MLEVSGSRTTGRGSPREWEEAVFSEKFARGREGDALRRAWGLGLAICRAIVEAHKGRMHAEAGRAKGARFVFTLPLGEPPDTQAPPE